MDSRKSRRRQKFSRARRQSIQKRPLNPPKPPKFPKLPNSTSQSDTKTAYQQEFDKAIDTLKRKLEYYLDNPEEHPFYNDEWGLYWNRLNYGLPYKLDPQNVHVQDNWYEYFLKRIQEIHEDEVKWNIEQIEKKFGMVSGSSIINPAENDKFNSFQNFVQNKRSRFDQVNPNYQSLQQTRSLVSNKKIENAKQKLEKIKKNFIPIILLDNVPLSMSIVDILDYFGNKLRFIVGCFRVIDYVSKIPSKMVYLSILDEVEVQKMKSFKEIYMDGYCVNISTINLYYGSAHFDVDDSETPEPLPSLSILNLEKRANETTHYLRELAKLFDAHHQVTGIRISSSKPSSETRNFGFVNFISKALVNEFDGRKFKIFDNEIECKSSPKVPFLISGEHADILGYEKIFWNKRICEINLLNTIL